MQIRIFSSTLVGGVWHEPGIGNYDPALAQYLIGLGVAEPYETKVSFPTELKKKPDQQFSASPPAPASRRPTAAQSKAKHKP